MVWLESASRDWTRNLQPFGCVRRGLPQTSDISQGKNKLALFEHACHSDQYEVNGRDIDGELGRTFEEPGRVFDSREATLGETARVFDDSGP